MLFQVTPIFSQRRTIDPFSEDQFGYWTQFLGSALQVTAIYDLPFILYCPTPQPVLYPNTVSSLVCEPNHTTDLFPGPSFQCRCHCTSTYLVNSFWLIVAPSVACYSYYKCRLLPKKIKILNWHGSYTLWDLTYLALVVPALKCYASRANNRILSWCSSLLLCGLFQLFFHSQMNNTCARSFIRNPWGLICFGIQNLSDFRKVIRCSYPILHNIPSGVWGNTL